jgi:hypothetical protein
MMPPHPFSSGSWSRYNAQLCDLIVDCDEDLVDEAAERAGDFLGELIHMQVPQVPLPNCQRLGYHVCSALPEIRQNASTSRLAAIGYEAIRRDGGAVRLSGTKAPTGRVAHTLRVAVRVLSRISVRLRIPERRQGSTASVEAVA